MTMKKPFISIKKNVWSMFHFYLNCNHWYTIKIKTEVFSTQHYPAQIRPPSALILTSYYRTLNGYRQVTDTVSHRNGYLGIFYGYAALSREITAIRNIVRSLGRGIPYFCPLHLIEKLLVQAGTNRCIVYFVEMNFWTRYFFN